MAPYVNCCVILLEVDGDSQHSVPDLSYKSQRYRDAVALGFSDELRFGRGDKSQTKGLRISASYTIETFRVSSMSFEPDKPETAGAEEVCAGSPPGRTSGDLELPKKIYFYSGNSFVEITKGIIHLYKENERSQLGMDKDKSGKTGPSDMLVMLAVPCYLSCRDLLQFVAPFKKDLDHIQIIREAIPNQYMALLKCNSEKAAATIYTAMNGEPYNSLEEEACRLAFVSRVESMRDDGGIGLPLLGHTELPTCPVCLERMDESVDGILTILCNHTFHSGCLSKWSDSRCPVCRYVQTPEMVAKNVCFECGSSESLWICLICGHIGCGRYVHGHAYKHFCETSHCYAIQPDNNRVWDYAGDNFVHRLLHNKDGKLVEVGNRGRPTDDCEDSDEKVDNLQLEFTYMLTTQMENQRHFFEERLEEQSKGLQKEMEKLQLKMAETAEKKQLAECRLMETVKERATLERKFANVNQKLTKVTAELKEEKELNKHLQQDQVKWSELTKKLEKDLEKLKTEKDTEVQDLKEQLRDVMFYFEAQKTIEESPLRAELLDGQVTVDKSSESPSTSKGARRKSKR
ncbi:BRCA1-associated protein [Orchesella cincta]|uniref:BRCA1-associated protein n=1 Tax=Orchesella cincta TaxID=48709 RepID=A0A1D2NG60_ORCCI|nr:BRCA1-associated protein [Orchesella cincta]